MMEAGISRKTGLLEAQDKMATKAAKIEALTKKIAEREALIKKHSEGDKKNSQTLRIDRKLLKRAMRTRKKLILGHKISKKMRKEGSGGEAPAAKYTPAKAAPAKAAPAAKAPADKAAAPAAKPAPATKAAPDAKQ